MEARVARPGVEYGGDAELATEALGIFAKLKEGARGRLEKQAEEPLLRSAAPEV